MPNAYAVSEPTKDQLRREGKNVVGDTANVDTSRSSRLQDKVSGEKTEIIRLKNGETRVRVELSERKRREDMLRRYGLLNSEESTKKRAERNDDEGDDYGSDFDEGMLH
jgi:uroporphyrinogen-III synthase